MRCSRISWAVFIRKRVLIEGYGPKLYRKLRMDIDKRYTNVRAVLMRFDILYRIKFGIQKFFQKNRKKMKKGVDNV